MENIDTEGQNPDFDPLGLPTKDGGNIDIAGENVLRVRESDGERDGERDEEGDEEGDKAITPKKAGHGQTTPCKLISYNGSTRC